MNSAPSPKPPGHRYAPPFEWRFLGPRFWPIWGGFALVWCLALWPARWREGLAGWIGRQIYRRNSKRRTITLTNLAWCFPELPAAEHERLARRYFRYLALAMLDVGLFWWGSEARFRRHIVLQDDGPLAASLAAGRRVIIVTCHTPGLDRGGVALSADYPFETFVNEARNPLLEWMSARRRVRFEGLVFPRSGGLRPVIKGLRQGYALYILTDEDLGPQSAEFAPFFGIPRATLTTPSRLARLADADVFTCFTWYDDSRHRYVVQLFSQVEGFPSGDELADATRLNGLLEQMIRQHPEQYMWSLRLFQTMQDGSPPPYRMKGKPGSGPRPRPTLDQ